jgi:arylsulfatase A-like enzyme
MVRSSVLVAAMFSAFCCCARVEGGEGTNAERPNVLLISLDTLRSDRLDVYGNVHPTCPNLRKMVEHGVVFTRSYSTSSWTLPAHASVFTGLPPHQHGCTEFEHKIHDSLPVLAEDLAAIGYSCAAFVNDRPLALRLGFNRGFALYDNYTVALEGTLESDKEAQEPKYEETITSTVITRSAVNWLRKTSGKGQPFFLFLHYFDIHHNYIAPGKYRTMFDPDYRGWVDGTLPQGRDTKFQERDREHLLALYDGEIAWVDEHLGKIFDELDKLGLRQSTVIVVFGDHGEEFNEHGKYFHAHTLYEELVRTPILVAWPERFSEKIVCNAPVSLTQIRDTILTAVGLAKANGDVPTLFEAAADPKTAESFIVAGSLDTEFKAEFIRRGDWKLVHTMKPETKWELFNLLNDPWEQVNLAEDNPAEFTLLKRLMQQEMPPDWTPGEKVNVPANEANKLKEMGYLGG